MNPTEKNNINPNFSGVTTGGQYAQMNNPAPIAVSGLSEPVKPFQPPQATPTDYSNVAQTSSAVAQIPTQTSTPTDTTGFLKAIQETSSKLGVQPDVPSLVQQYKDLTGIDTAQLPAERQQAQAKVQELTAKLAMLDAKALKNQEDAMKRGETMGFASREAQNIARTDAIERLATSSELNAYQGRLDTAKQNVTDILNLQSKDLENKKQQQDTLFNNAKDIASADQQVALEKSRQEASRKLAQENDFANLRQALASKLAEKGDIQGAIKIAKTQNVGELNYIKNTMTNGVGLTPEQASDPFIVKISKTVGGKPITDAFAQKLNKGLTVLDQIGLLQTNIKDIKTGPIVGLFRGANPWDTNAQTIKAQLNAIVPNLARGVFGEVGVLTDNDIAQYSKTLPNLKSTEDIRNAVLGITVDLIGKSIKQTLEVNAANQKDVSGFIDIYSEMKRTRDNIFKQIPGYKNPSTGTESSNITTTKSGKTFDYQSAKNAGYTDAEIQSYLNAN